MKNILSFVVIIFFMLYGCQPVYRCNLKAFTHPEDLSVVSLYSKPNKFYRYLQSDIEAGWIISVEKKYTGFFYIKLPEECKLSKKNVWIKAGDIGVVIQNYDSIKIPIYVSVDTLSQPSGFIYISMIGKVYDIKDNLVLLGITLDNGEITQGWVEKKYLCGNPYTTCN